MKIALVTLALVSMAMAGGADAAPKGCRDAKGKFVKCPPAAAAPIKCKDAKGKFAKCGAPGATPVKK